MEIKKISKNALQFLNIKRCRKLGLAPNGIPFLFLWVTNKCNLQCKMCDQWKANGPDSLAYRDLFDNSIFCESPEQYWNPPDNFFTYEGLMNKNPNLFISVDSTSKIFFFAVHSYFKMLN